MHGKIKAIIVTVEPPINDKIGPKLGSASATPIMKRTIAVRSRILFQPNPKKQKRKYHIHKENIILTNRSLIYHSNLCVI